MSIRTFLHNFQIGVRSIPLENLMAKYCDRDSKFIAIDGHRIHYRDQGKGPVLLLLHGVVSSLHTWDGWYDALGGHYRIIRPDLPGWGITGPSPDRNYLAARINAFLDRFLDELGIERCHVAGNSLGGFYAWNYAVHRPGRVMKLVLLDPIGYNQSLPYEFRLVRIPGMRFMVNRIMLPRFLIMESIRRLYGRRERITPGVYDRYWELLMRKGNRQTLTRVFFDIAALSKSDTIYLPVKQIKIPVLIMWGRQDIWARWNETLGEWLRDLPQAELVMYEECGHMPMEEIPVETARDAHAFLQKKERGRMTGRPAPPKGKKAAPAKRTSAGRGTKTAAGRKKRR